MPRPKASRSKKMKTKLVEGIESTEISKKLQSLMSLGLEKLSTNLEVAEKKAENAQKIDENLEKLDAARYKDMERDHKEIARLRLEVQDAKALHKQVMPHMIEEAKRSATIIVLQSRIEMAEEAAAEGFHSTS